MYPHHCPNPTGPSYLTTAFTPQIAAPKFKVGDRVCIKRESVKHRNDSTRGAFPQHFDRSQGVIIRIPGIFGECSVELKALDGTRKDSFSVDFAQLDKHPDDTVSSALPRVTPSVLHPDPISPDLAFFSRCASPGACEKCAAPLPCGYHS